MDEYMLNDLLECSVCLERLDTSSRVLPCQHTFCKKCLEEIVATKKELRCPECRVLVTIKIDDLPPNVLLMRILGGMRSNSNSQSKPLKPSILSPPIGSAPVAQIQPRAAAVVAPEITRVHHSPSPLKQTLLPNTPYARAVYDYLSNEPGDLRFKKGDVIVLRKKMDANWYHGESGGNHGVFPLTYVQVMNPLPSHIPQCKALYDFRMTNDDEEGCLTFNKGEVITVIRRVDENWAEGKLTDRIGIFPLAFVELNNVARALMKLSTNSQPGPSRVAPPTPTSEDTTPLIPTDHSRTVSAAPPRHHITMGAASDSSSTVSSASSSTTTPATSSSNTSSSSSTAPSSPASPPPPRPAAAAVGSPPPRPAHAAGMSPPAVGQAQSRGKRHSFTMVNSAGHAPLASHSWPHESPRVIPKRPEVPLPGKHSAEILASSGADNLSAEVLDLSMAAQLPEPMPRQGSQRHRRSGSQDGAPPPQGVHSSAPLPAHYVALYAYKPQKADEMELRKGSVYVVTERCQDGWFKGTSSRTQKGGVFPGNYVVPAKVVQAQLRSSRPSSSPQPSPRANGADAAPPAAAISYTRSGGSPFATASRQPPELPPRAVSPQWADPSRTPDKKERKEKGNSSSGVSLMRRLQTSIKKSKSPPPSYSMDNPVFDDGSVTASPVHPVHVRLGYDVPRGKCLRSGSCPSQLLQAPSLDGSTAHHRLFPSVAAAAGTGSQRVKHKSDRPSVVPNASVAMFPRVSGESAATGAAAAAPSGAVANHHRKSNSLDAGSGDAARKPTKVGSTPVRERFRCIVPYPPNSEYELELRVGDVIYVHKKRDDGWYKGTQQRTGKTGLFPASFVEIF